MNKILIYGAGALGRGFLSPTFFNAGYEVFFVDKDPKIINLLNRRIKCYKTAQTVNNQYKIQDVYYQKAFLFGEEDNILQEMDFILTSVGQRNLSKISKKFRNTKTIISFENDSYSTHQIKKDSGNNNCYFGIPDVIVSNTSPQDLQQIDPLCVVSECGELILEKGEYDIDDSISQVGKKEMDERWACKFFLHNTPHASIAYLGWKNGHQYIHEAMKDGSIYEITVEIINIIKKCLIKKRIVNPKLANYYTKRELERFKNQLLYDPISRVAREPFRKLGSNDRLISCLRLIDECDENVIPLCKVINSVFEYNNPLNDDGIVQLVIRNGKYSILNNICRIRSDENLFKLILNCDFV